MASVCPSRSESCSCASAARSSSSRARVSRVTVIRPARRRSPRGSRRRRAGRSGAPPRCARARRSHGVAPISSATGSTHSIRRSIRARAGTTSPRSRSISSPDSPWRIARHMFSSIRRCGWLGSGSPSSSARAQRAVSETMNATSDCASARSGCASQMRISTVGNARCGRTLHQSCVGSSTDPVA